MTDRPLVCRRIAEEELRRFVAAHFEKRERLLSAAAAHGSPLYLIDAGALRARARRFLTVWGAALAPRGLDFCAYYAIKSNSHPEIARLLAAEGLGLDASSGRELELALSAGARRVLFSGPGKTAAELDLALEHAPRVTLLIDSFGELRRLEERTARRDLCVRAGVRLTTEEAGLWRKFGIPLAQLPDFCAAAERGGRVTIAGLQFHSSWNLAPDRQIAFLERLGRALPELPAATRARLAFLDIGGGFWPEQGEWLHEPPLGSALEDAGEFQDASTEAPQDASSSPASGEGPPAVRPHFVCPAQPLEVFADRIAEAVRERITPRAPVSLACEPGRWLSHEAMHLLLTVVDAKRPDLVITDAGTNAVGWERFESDYFPVLNLTRPSLVERPCDILGSLCTPHDVWGYSYFGEGIGEGDVLLIPTQGAYTYSLRQEFIKPLPACALIQA